MKILIAGGGSGGHIFPAYALVCELQRRNKDIDFVFVISGRSEERIISDYLCRRLSNFRIKIIPWFPLRGKDIFALTDFLTRLLWAGSYSFLFVLLQRPAVVAGFGGYLSAPLIVAASVLGIPTLIHEQNICPGRANIILSNFADRVALSFEESRKYFRKKRKLVVTGNPVRPDLVHMDRKAAAESFGFNPEVFTILILGGSQGATPINREFTGALKHIKKEGMRLQFIHITGRRDFPWVVKAYKELGLGAEVFPFLEEIGPAYICSDLVISRAGASTLNELSCLAKAVLSIPYPYAGGHQLLNARYYAQRNALVVLEEKDLSSELLFDCIYGIMGDRGKKEMLGSRIKEINLSNAASLLAGEVWELADAQ